MNTKLLLARAIGDGEENGRRVPGDTLSQAAAQQIQISNGRKDEASNVVDDIDEDQRKVTIMTGLLDLHHFPLPFLYLLKDWDWSYGSIAYFLR